MKQAVLTVNEAVVMPKRVEELPRQQAEDRFCKPVAKKAR